MYRIVGIKVHPANDNEIEFVSEKIRDRRLANEFYKIILDCKVFYDIRLEERVFDKWFSIEVEEQSDDD